jgi:hypothetical protein
MSSTSMNDRPGHHGKPEAPTGPRTRFAGPAGRDRLPVNQARAGQRRHAGPIYLARDTWLANRTNNTLITARRPAVMGGKLVASVAIYVAPERLFGAGGAR